MSTIKREGNIIYIQHSKSMKRVGELIGGVTTGKGGLMADSANLLLERDERKHLMEVWNAYGFAKEVIDHKDWFDTIQLTETKKDGSTALYIIPRIDLILHGKEYQADDYERQYFVTKEKLKQYQV